MHLPQDAMLLRIFIGESDRWHHKPLYESIVLKARELHLAGATVLRGPMGFGKSSVLLTAKILRLSMDLPLLSHLFVADDRPVKRVVLFTSGVGVFQLEGEGAGDTSVQLSFRTEQINHFLKSLVLQDFGGGKIAPVVFGSRDPIERTLKSFAIDLTDNPPLSELLNRMRGVEAEITAPKEIQGVIVGVESHEQKIKDDVIQIFMLNLMTAQGLCSVPMEQ